MDQKDPLQRRIQQLETELTEARQKNLELERAKTSASGDDITVPISEFEETLRRLVQRTAMIVQAEKCVIMVRDRETGDLVARAPAWGMSEVDVKAFRVDLNNSISGGVFQTGLPAIFHNPEDDP